MGAGSFTCPVSFCGARGWIWEKSRGVLGWGPDAPSRGSLFCPSSGLLPKHPGPICLEKAECGYRCHQQPCSPIKCLIPRLCSLEATDGGCQEGVQAETQKLTPHSGGPRSWGRQTPSERGVTLKGTCSTASPPYRHHNRLATSLLE